MKKGQMTQRRAATLVAEDMRRLRAGEVANLRDTYFGLSTTGYWVASNGATVDSLSQAQATEAIVGSLTGK